MKMGFDWITPKQASEKWGITERQVQSLCKRGKIPDVMRLGRSWVIPKTTLKPMDGRTRAAKQKNKPLEFAHTLEADRIIEMVNGTMAIESMPLTDEDRGRLRSIMRGEITADDMVRQLVAKHRRSADAGRLRL